MSVFISYSRLDGRHLAELLVNTLRARSMTAHWDQDVPSHSPSSLQEWMDDQVDRNIVLCVVSPAYADRFTLDRESDHGRGVVYESRAIRTKLYDHMARDRCPVIPVVDATMTNAKVPSVLRRLKITTVNPATGAGIEEVIQRVRALARPASSTEPPGSSSHISPEDQLRHLLAGVEHNHSSPDAADTVRQLLDLADRYPDRTAHDLADGFPYAEKVVKAIGDLSLMRRLSDTCLTAIDRASPQLKKHDSMKARVLICGRGWHLQREHRLDEALSATLEGVTLATSCGPPLTEAFGNKCLGRLHRLRAESSHEDRDRHTNLRESVRRLHLAYERFLELKGDAMAEAGDAKSLEGRTWLVHYRLTRNATSLHTAARCAHDAAELIPVSLHSKDYFDMVILRAEIDLESHQFKRAKTTLDDVVERLRKRRDAAYDEILARTLQVRALLQTAATARPRDLDAGLRDARESEEIFARAGMAGAAAVSQWIRAVLDPREFSSRGVSVRALGELAEMEPDPAVRLLALATFAAQERERVGKPLTRRTSDVDWEPVLRRVCRLGPHPRRGTRR